MTRNQYNMLLALEELEKENFMTAGSEKEYVKDFKERMDKKNKKLKEEKQKELKTEVSEDVVKEVQKRIEQNIIKQKEQQNG